MSSSQPRRRYRRLEKESVTIHASGLLEPRPIESRTGHVVAGALHAFVGWRTRRMSPGSLERARREQKIFTDALRREDPAS